MKTWLMIAFCAQSIGEKESHWFESFKTRKECVQSTRNLDGGAFVHCYFSCVEAYNPVGFEAWLKRKKK